MSDNKCATTGVPIEYRFAGGRRHYNAVRRLRADYRQMLVAKLLTFDRGTQTRIAKQFGVHRSTICRDAAKMHQSWLESRWRQPKIQRLMKELPAAGRIGRIASLLGVDRATIKNDIRLMMADWLRRQENEAHE
ncbi:MAG: hypothetical protein K8T25_09595 [Planctomycetia bacterium]|nr:hypothetical protein [Planctomycetia bacterium]